MSEPDLAFRPMEATELPTLAAWLDRPHVQPWWRPQDLDDVRHAVYGEEDVEPWILVIDGADGGYFQVYDVGYDPERAPALASVGAGPGTAGIDYLLADPTRIGGGIGTRAVSQFVGQIVFEGTPWPAVCAGPDPENRASIRILEKNGFHHVGTVDTSWGREHVMLLTRDKWQGGGNLGQIVP